MATVTENISDIFLATEVVSVLYIAEISDPIIVADKSAGKFTQVISDSFEANDSIGSVAAANISDSITAVDSVISSALTGQTITDSFTIDDAVLSTVHEAISDSFEASDAVSQQTFENISDSITAVDQFTEAVLLRDSVSDVIVATDSVYAPEVDTITESITADDVVTEFIKVSETISDTFEATDSVTQSGLAEQVIQDIIIAADSVTQSGVFNEIISDSIVVYDAVYSLNPAAVAWVVNTETGAPSYYLNYQFNAIVEYRGLLIAASPEGFYLLEGDDDAGSDINAELATGMEDFDIKNLKRIDALYLGYTGGELELDVETQRAGNKYTYTLEPRDADAPRNNRIKLGKGLKDRYWRFTLRNCLGSDFSIDDMEANVIPTNRRL